MEEDLKLLEEYRDDELFGIAGREALENLLKAYKNLQEIEQYHKAENGKLKESLDEHMKLNAELISKIKETLEENKAKTDCRYCNNACDSYAVCEVLKNLLKEGE